MWKVEPDPPATAGAAATAVEPGAGLRRDPRWATAGAIWDIWSADDEPRLTAFLWRVAGQDKQLVGHPIHDANIYLGESLRRRSGHPLAASAPCADWRSSCSALAAATIASPLELSHSPSAWRECVAA